MTIYIIINGLQLFWRERDFRGGATNELVRHHTHSVVFLKNLPFRAGLQFPLADQRVKKVKVL